MEKHDIKEESLRPKLLDDFNGQTHLKTNLQIFIDAAKKRKEALDHILFYGPPGLGKTTLSFIIAKEMQANIKITSGPSLSKVADLNAILTNLKKGDVLFIDEIHRLPITIEEVLYTAMEDFALDIMIGTGPSVKVIRVQLAKFTLIGATTRFGLLSNPLRDRFGIIHRLEMYSIEELVNILFRTCKILSLTATSESLEQIAKRSRGTPRIAIRILRRVRDFIEMQENRQLEKDLTIEILRKIKIDEYGLNENDHRYLKFIIDNYHPASVGIETIASGVLEKKDTIEDVIEPYLIQIGFLNKTSRGRVLTEKALLHVASLYVAS